MANVVRFVASRIIKLVGNSTKAVSYPFHFAFPRKRFVIPASSKPLLRNPAVQAIPKTIWQTNHTDKVTIAVYLNYLFNRLMAPTYAYRFMGQSEMDSFIETHCSRRAFECYSKLQIGAAQADLWRLLVLQKHGGVYLDMDAHVVWPLEFIVKSDCRELYLVARDGFLTNYFIASTNDNPTLDRVIDAILDNIEKRAANDVGNLTGPEAMNRALAGLNLPATSFRHTCIQGTFTNEFFQYVDHPQGKWGKAQKRISVIRD